MASKKKKAPNITMPLFVSRMGDLIRWFEDARRFYGTTRPELPVDWWKDFIHFVERRGDFR